MNAIVINSYTAILAAIAASFGLGTIQAKNQRCWRQSPQRPTTWLETQTATLATACRPKANRVAQMHSQSSQAGDPQPTATISGPTQAGQTNGHAPINNPGDAVSPNIEKTELPPNLFFSPSSYLKT
jgi:hypothetical protein